MAFKDREMIGTVVLLSGRKLSVRMPNMEDIEDLYTGAASSRQQNIMYMIASKSVNMSLKEFKALGVPDGLIVMNKINPAIQSIMTYMATLGGSDVKY